MRLRSNREQRTQFVTGISSSDGVYNGVRSLLRAQASPARVIGSPRRRRGSASRRERRMPELRGAPWEAANAIQLQTRRVKTAGHQSDGEPRLWRTRRPDWLAESCDGCG